MFRICKNKYIFKLKISKNNTIDFGWDTFTDEQKLQKRAIELNNGRAATINVDDPSLLFVEM